MHDSERKEIANYRQIEKVTNERIFKMAADKPHCNCANVSGKREMMLSSTTAVIQVTKRGNGTLIANFDLNVNTPVIIRDAAHVEILNFR